MTNHAMLNSVEHKDLRVYTGHGAAWGDDVMYALAIPSEFRNLVCDYPIFFSRDENGRMLPLVMLGFEEGENLFLDGEHWRAGYLPLMVRRGPFMIGFQGGESGMGRDTARNMVISIDLDNPRVGSEGEPVFQPAGGNTDYTDKVIEILQAIDQGQEQIDEFCRLLAEYDLFETFSLAVTLASGKRHSLEGFQTINEEKLAALAPDVLADLSRRGMLHAAYMVVASMANIPRLIEFKNRRDSGTE